MAEINFTIPDDKLYRVVQAFLGLYKKPENFTAGSWTKECVRRWVRDQVARYEQRENIKNIDFVIDDDIIA